MAKDKQTPHDQAILNYQQRELMYQANLVTTQDKLNAAVKQREDALNEILNCQARNAQLQRANDELVKAAGILRVEVAALKTAVELKNPKPNAPKVKSNGTGRVKRKNL